MLIRTILLAWLIGLAIGLLVSALPGAMAEGPEVHRLGEVHYIDGGFGMEDREAMRALAGQFNLHMMFSSGQRGELVAKVALTVRDAKGNNVLELAEAGPLTYMQVRPGQYWVSASYQGMAITKAVTLGTGARELFFQWPASVQHD